MLLELGLEAIYLLREVEDGRTDFLEALKVVLQGFNLLVMLVDFKAPVRVLDKSAQLVELKGQFLEMLSCLSV